VPEWLAPYNYSHTYEGFNLDTTSLDEKKLRTDGLMIQRCVEENADPKEHLKKLSLNDYAPKFTWWKNSYSRIVMEAKAKKLSPKSKKAVMTVGLAMPEEYEWKKNIF
jgi:hypothetical protein